ncbi:MAG: Flp family type IVb pilin [Acidimicrobiia bacterium]
MKVLAQMKRLSERGASMVEYGLLVALIAIVGLASISMVGDKTDDQFTTIAQGLSNPDGGGSSELSGQSGEDLGGGGSGGSGGGATTTTTTPPTTTTTVPPTTTSTIAPTTTTTVVVQPSSPTTTGTSSELYEWNSTKQGGNGKWTASVTYQNDWSQPQHLTLEVTKTDEKGKTETITVEDFLVPARANATLDLDDNEITVKNKKTSGVMTVDVKVTSIRTTDQNGTTVTYPAEGLTGTMSAPETP